MKLTPEQNVANNLRNAVYPVKSNLKILVNNCYAIFANGITPSDETSEAVTGDGVIKALGPVDESTIRSMLEEIKTFADS